MSGVAGSTPVEGEPSALNAPVGNVDGLVGIQEDDSTVAKVENLLRFQPKVFSESLRCGILAFVSVPKGNIELCDSQRPVRMGRFEHFTDEPMTKRFYAGSAGVMKRPRIEV